MVISQIKQIKVKLSVKCEVYPAANTLHAKKEENFS